LYLQSIIHKAICTFVAVVDETTAGISGTGVDGGTQTDEGMAEAMKNT
jgi:hypothetical protein